MAKVATFKGELDEHGIPVEYLGGIPATDLDEDTWQALTDEQRAAVAASSLYALTDTAEKAITAAERKEARAEAAAAKEASAN